MNSGEIKALKDVLNNLTDKILPEVVAAEEARLGAYAALAAPIAAVLLPVVQAKIDAAVASWLDSIVPSDAPVSPTPAT